MFKPIMPLLLIYISLFAATSLFAQTYKVSDFLELAPPEHGSQDWYALNRSDYNFAVRNNNGALEITNSVETNKVEFTLDDGKLVGTDKAELGGKLTFVPNDASKPTVEIKKGNIRGFFKLKDQLYFIEGPSKIFKNKGTINKLDRKGDAFVATKVLDLLDAPEAYSLRNDTLFVASQENFYLVHDMKREVIVNNAFWSGFYPNSVAVIDPHNVYVGMKAGYVKVDLITKKMKLYKFDEHIKEIIKLPKLPK